MVANRMRESAWRGSSGNGSSNAREGAKSLQISLPGQSSATITSRLAPVQAGQDYLLSFWYRSKGFSETGAYAGVNLQYVLIWLDANQKPIGTGGMGLSYGAVPEWRFMVSMLTVPPKAAAVRISFPMSVNETGRPSRFWLDVVRLRAWPGEPKRGGRTWRFSVAEGYYQHDLFRRVADDETASGFAVLANPRFNSKPGYLAANLYTRILPPGQYRAVFRLKVGEIPAAPSAAMAWDVNTDSIGHLSAGSISTAVFKQAGKYQEVNVRFVLSPGVAWVAPAARAVYPSPRFQAWHASKQRVAPGASCPRCCAAAGGRRARAALRADPNRRRVP